MILGEDSTEAYNFILMDRAVKRMIGMTATKKISDMKKVETHRNNHSFLHILNCILTFSNN